MNSSATAAQTERSAWADAPWTLHVVVICLAIAAIIKTFVPSSLFVMNFIAASVYGFSIRFGAKLLTRLFPSLPMWACFSIAAPVGVVIGAVFDLYVIGAEGLALRNHQLPFWQYIVTSLIFTGAAIYFIYTRGHLLQVKAHLQQEQLQRTNQAKLLAESQLRALQSQIEPHFIFNTLANVQGLIETDPAAARRMLESFTRLLRVTLQRGRDNDARLMQEIDVVREYLSIQQQRLGARLRFRLEIAPDLNDLPFPPLLLQPLVENAVKHGIEPSIAGGEVSVTVAHEDGGIVIRVRDTGRGFVENGQPGIGLANVRERLANMYGAAASLELTEDASGGVCATLTMPLRAQEPSHE